MASSRPPFLPLIEDDGLFVGRKDNYEWVESTFEEAGASTIKQEFLGVSISKKKISLFLIATIAILGIFGMRSSYLQVVQGAELAGRAERNKLRIQAIPAKRGVIYDARHTLLAGNVPRFSILITPIDLPLEDALRTQALDEVAQAGKIDREELARTIEEADPYTAVSVKDNIEYDAALKLKARLADLAGVDVAMTEQRRYYLDGVLSLSHILGYTGKISQQELEKQEGYLSTDVIGKSGLELSHEALLRGEYGKKQSEVDALGREKDHLVQAPPKDGKSLTLTLDLSLQRYVEQVLTEVMKEYRTTRGVVIVSDPTTGGILSMVSLPAYDANLFAQRISREDYRAITENPDKPLLNRAVSGDYPSGSTIKMIVAAAGLDQGVVTANTLIRSSGGLQVGSWFFPDWKAGGHGLTSVTKALAESVNTFFYILGGGFEDTKGMGALALIDALKKFGLGERTNVDLPQERMGFIPTPTWKQSTVGEPWYVGDTYHMAIGQGDVLVTPLQVNLYTQYFANKGKSYTPHFVAQTTDEATSTVSDVIPEVYRESIIKEQSLNTVREGLRRAVTEGSAVRLSTLAVSAAGKTGTAQWGKDKTPHAWFTGWAPYDSPKVAITVLVEEGVEGSQSAISVAHQVLKWYFEPETRVVQTEQEAGHREEGSQTD